MSYEVQVRRPAELDIAEAQVWYESQRSGLGGEFRIEISRVLDRLAETPLVYQIVHRDVRRAIVRRFSYLIWYRLTGETVIVLACTYAGRIPSSLSRGFRKRTEVYSASEPEKSREFVEQGAEVYSKV